MNEDGLIQDERFRILDDMIWINEAVAQKWLSTAIFLWHIQEEIGRLCILNKDHVLSDQKLRQEIQEVLAASLVA